MRNYKVIIRIDDTETDTIEIQAKNWEELVNYILGRIEIINTEE